jgi:hypothetical protein
VPHDSASGVRGRPSGRPCRLWRVSWRHC